MGILDRQRQKDSNLSLPIQDSELSTLVRDEISLPADVPVVLKRIEATMNYFLKSSGDNAKSRKYRRIIAMITQDALEEIEIAPPELVEYYFTRAAALIYWSATGQRIINVPWPDDFVIPPELSGLAAENEIVAGEQKELERA
jgi:hypothetical protein